MTEAFPPSFFTRAATWTEMLFYKSITSNFMGYQGRFETNLLQLFVHPETSEWLSIMFGITKFKI